MLAFQYAITLVYMRTHKTQWRRKRRSKNFVTSNFICCEHNNTTVEIQYVHLFILHTLMTVAAVLSSSFVSRRFKNERDNCLLYALVRERTHENTFTQRNSTDCVSTVKCTAVDVYIVDWYVRFCHIHWRSEHKHNLYNKFDKWERRTLRTKHTVVFNLI